MEDKMNTEPGVGETKIENRMFAWTPTKLDYNRYSDIPREILTIWLKVYYTQYRFTMLSNYSFGWVEEGYITKEIFDINKKTEKSQGIGEYKKWRDPLGYV